ncbi:MAG: hypothetical protein H0T89_05790 [Deltaproteobacteria bacterium]|nr:hypothetical protein [Deltaproteobacteria bacterium]MDQ3298145.1 hypothetical protein [Myxococcota bacterium]
MNRRGAASRVMARWPALPVVAICAACSQPDGNAAPPAPATPVAKVDDRQPIPKPPSEPVKTPMPAPFPSNAMALQPIADPRIVSVNSLDEVPDSTWFTNRNTVSPLSADAIRKGPGPHATPRDDARWTIIGVKETGVALGLRAVDETGAKFFLKFDPDGHHEVETGADVVVQRLLFAAGYNVPENDVVYVSRAALTIDPKATFGRTKRALRGADVDRLLARAARETDGRYRVLASRFLPGSALGGTEPAGRRRGDPNDAIPHEHRRDVRGLYTLAAWLNHTDIKSANTLDVWIPDPADPSRGHVVHYLLDFGKALGAITRIDPRPEAGFAHDGAIKHRVKEIATLGHVKPPWADIGPFPDLRGLGWIESERFDPANWKPLHPWLPFVAADRFDKFWGARIVMSFTPEQIRAALAAARYTDPRTVEYLARVLVERQRKIGEHFFGRVAPLERFRVNRDALCFDDLRVRYGLRSNDAIYAAEVRGDHAQPWRQTGRSNAQGTVCLADVPRLPEAVTTAIEVRVAGPGRVDPATVVHLTGGRPAVVAIERR